MPKRHKKSSLDKALSKATMKASKQISKGVKKLNKSITKAVRKKAKQHEGVLAKRKRDIDRWAAKALELNRKTQETLNEMKKARIPVEENEDTIRLTDQRIRQIVAKSRPTEKDLELLKEWARPSHYNYIKVRLDIRKDEVDDKGASKQDVDDITVPEGTLVSLKEIRKVLAKQLNKPENLTDEQRQIIAQYSQAISDYVNSSVTDLSTEEAQQRYIKRFNRTRDVSIGGNSSLINDLSYTYDCNDEGREFVETIQRAMSNPQAFVQIEGWYQSNDKLQDEIDKAKGHNWYDKFQDIRVTILSFLNTDAIKNVIPSDINDKFDSLRERLEAAADENAEG